MDTAHALAFDEQALVQRCKERDADAFQQVVVRYQDKILNAVYRLTGGDYQLSLDLTQETFIHAFRAIHAFEQRSALSSWLYRIAANLCLDHRRAQKRRKETSLEAIGRPDDGRGGYDPPDPGPEPAASQETRERREQVRRAIEDLPQEFRTVIVLRDLEGLSYEEIGEILKCPAGTVKSRLHRARVELKEKLKGVLL